MIKNCAVSGQEFEITKEDLKFYENIGVSEPTISPSERLRRRFLFRNERDMYHRECDGTGKKIVSYYSSDKDFPVYEKNYWWSDVWDPSNYAVDYDESKSFFKQFGKLRQQVPRANMIIHDCENCDWSPYGLNSKDCYMSVSCNSSERVHYSFQTNRSDDCIDMSISQNCTLCYEDINCTDCYKVLFSQFSHNCSNSYFLKNCEGCKDCFACINLKNSQYCFLNKQYTKEQYEKKLQEIGIQKYSNIKNMRKEFYNFSKKHPHLFMFGEGNENVSGDNIHNSKNVENCFDVNQLEDCKYVMFNPSDLKNSYDVNYTPNSEYLYECLSACNSYNSKFLLYSRDMKNSDYCDECFDSEDLFGCIGLRNKKYCIFNKQYTKEEYFQLREAIINQMKKDGEWGEFFPGSLSPFSYNETIANQYFPLIKSDVIQNGYTWKDRETKAKYSGSLYDIPDSIGDVDDNILENILSCESCTKNYRIIAPELKFYKKLSLPIPRKCQNCRYDDRIKLRNPRVLNKRQCDKCSKDIKTVYTPGSPEVIYCKECYNKEFY